MAERLNVSERWLEEHTQDGPPYIKLAGRTVRYPEEQLIDWLKQQPTNLA